MRLWVPTAMTLHPRVAERARGPAQVQVAEVPQDILPLDPEVPVVRRRLGDGVDAAELLDQPVLAVAMPDGPQQLRLRPDAVAGREAPAPPHAAPRVLEAQQAVAPQPLAVDDGVGMPGHQARGDAHALDVAELPRLGVRCSIRELRRADAQHATAVAVALESVVEDLVPLPRRRPSGLPHGRRGLAAAAHDLGGVGVAPAQRDGFRDPASEVEHVGAGI
mmetsp:Transcript_9979/g.28596  ORF Transcript_9979/g.28596 Transcript_9979/m.28596 type:complete len:220 (+) Transcript_9979:1287-1946(+)